MLSFFPGKSSVNKAVVLLFKMSLGSFLLLSPHSCSWTVAEVRDYVDKKLREFGLSKRVVMDGRDIGTTVFPEAELKIFMTAAPLVRARRRADEMEAKGMKVDINDVLANLQERDYIDSHREVSPLAKAEDAIVLDNSEMTMSQQMEWLKGVIAERFGNQKMNLC